VSSNGTRATLALEDGVMFEGRSFGATGETTGEVVFNTALCGYQEVLTDPSYAGQIVTMTYPHIGNYGVNRDDVESTRPQVAGFIVREVSTKASSWRASGELHQYLEEAGVVGISEIDTRALTRHLRTFGAKRGVVSTISADSDTLVAKARASRSALAITRAALQMHGAIGYTEEHDIGLYYKRAMTLAAQYGGELGHTGAFSHFTLEPAGAAP